MTSQISTELRNELTHNLADNLAVFRAKLGITQAELAQRVGITANALNYIENKKREMTWVVFVALILMFSQKENTKTLVDAFNLFPDELKNFLFFDENTNQA